MRKKKTRPGLRRLLDKRQVEEMGSSANRHIDKHVIRRLDRFSGIKRFLFGWLGLILLLIIALFMQVDSLRDKYQTLKPASGGAFTEGIVGEYSNANPLYATSAVDASVSKLIFAGLFQYDSENRLAPQLAENIQVDKTEKTYTVTLKPDLTWHDGNKLTSEDVVFTYQLIQNPDARSYLLSNWKGITVEAKDERTVVFKLPSILSSFPHSLTNGIVPKHLLQGVNPEQLRSNNFNTLHPVGAGPFRFEAVELEDNQENQEKRQERIGLIPFKNYTLGQPRLNRYTIKTFASQSELEKQYADKQLTAMSGLPTVPDRFSSDRQTEDISLPLSGQVMVFFKTTEPPLDQSDVRRALVLGANRQEILHDVGYPLLPSDEPLLRSQIGYNRQFAQKTADLKSAKKLLDGAGWKVNPKDGIRKHGSKRLSFRLYSEANSEYASVTQSLQKQWKALGVDVQVSLQASQDLQSTVANHDYGALLYAISSGADPDVYAFWHSSQADLRSKTRLNFSEYRSPIVDIALEGGRSRTDPKIRTFKYRPFLQQFIRDNPALALYHPRFLMVVHKPFDGLGLSSAVTPADRYSNVQNWTVKQARQ